MKANYLLIAIFTVIASVTNVFSQELKFTEDTNSYTYMKGDTLIQEYYTDCGGVGHKVEIEGGTTPYTITWNVVNATVINSDSIYAEPVLGYSLASCTVVDANLDSIYKEVYIYNVVIFSGLPLESMEQDTIYWIEHKPFLSKISGAGIYYDSLKTQYYFRPDKAGVGTHVISFSYNGPKISDPDSTCVCNGNGEPFTILVYEKLEAYGNDFSTCESEDVHLYTHVSGGVPPYSYEWTGPFGETSNVRFLIMDAYYFPGTYDYSCKVTDTKGNSVIAYSSVIIVDRPYVFIEPIDGTVCEGDIISLSASSSWYYSHSWAGSYVQNNGSSSTTFGPAPEGTYDVYVLVEDLLGCKTIAYTTITVSPKPTVVIDPVPFMCENDAPHTLTAIPNGGMWYGPGVTSNYFNPHAAGEDVHQINYMFIDANGCAGEATTEVVVNPTPAPPTVSTSEYDLCKGVSPNPITINTLGAITWYNENVIISTESSFTPPTDVEGSTQYQVSQTINGCEGERTTVQVNVHPNPAPTITSNIPLNQANSSPISLEVTSIGNPIFSYNWAGSASVYLDATDISSPTFSNYSLGTYSLSTTVTDIYGCIGTANETITHSAALTPVIIGAIPQICIGEDVLLEVNGGLFDSYNWTCSDNGIDFSSSTDAQTTITGLSAGTYTITVTVTDNTGNTGSDSITIVVGELQPNTIIPSVPNLIYNTTEMFELHPAPYHSFSGNGIVQPSSFDPTIAGVGTHTIQITVNNPASCQAPIISTFTIDVIQACLVNADFTIFTNELHNLYEFEAVEKGNVTYFWTLPDGTEYSGINKQHISHEFNENITGSVCLTVVDNENATTCADTVCKSYTFLGADALLSITGEVFYDCCKVATCGKTVAFRLDNNEYIPVDTVEIQSDGTYLHTNLYKGTYIVLAHPCDTQQYIPTYFYNSLTQKQAPSFYLYDHATSVDIMLLESSTNISSINADNIKLYPNPMVHSAIVELGEIEATEVAIFTQTGTLVRTLPIHSQAIIIDRQELASGTYIVVITNNIDIVSQHILLVK